MSVDNNNFKEQRRRRAENFQLKIQDNYDYESESLANDSAELNSYSGQDVKDQIARESKHALKKKRKQQKKEMKAKNKRNRRVFRWIWVTSVVIVGVMLSTFIITGMNDLLAVNRTDNTQVRIQFEKDPTIDEVTEVLVKKEIINEPLYFELFAGLTSSSENFHQGTYNLRKNMDYQAIISALESSTNTKDIVTITIIEGQNILEVGNLLKKEGALADLDKFLELCNSDEFDEDFSFLADIDKKEDRYYKLEGYLYPDQYDFYLNEDPESIIFKMLRNYDQKITEKNSFNGYDELSTVQKMAENSEYSLDEIMVIASIIQDEAADENDMYTISSIIHNRLDADVDMGVSNLGLDSTKYYPYASKEDVPDSEGDDYVSKYDTYSKAGLPAGPICNPRIEAIKAALCPNDTSYYYFCHDSEGNAYYASTMYEHEQNLENLE